MQTDESRSRQICQILLVQSKPITSSELGEILGLPARDLRAHGEAQSILDQASAYALRYHGKAIIRSMSGRGIKLTDDTNEIWAARNEWNSIANKLQARCREMDEAIDHILELKSGRKQLQLPFLNQ